MKDYKKESLEMTTEINGSTSRILDLDLTVLDHGFDLKIKKLEIDGIVYDVDHHFQYVPHIHFAEILGCVHLPEDKMINYDGLDGYSTPEMREDHFRESLWNVNRVLRNVEPF